MTRLVELVGAGYAYEDGPAVLSGVDFGILEGRALVLLGRNGSGKTTLMRLLSGGLKPGPGELRLDGAVVAYDRAGLTRLRTSVQLVVQDPDDQLFAASVEQDVSFGPMNMGLPVDEVRSRVDSALAALDITALRGRPTHLLSYGQRKRAAIAGAVAMAPRVLILDEPTAGLDPDGQERLLDVLAGLRAAGTTVVMATHDVDLAVRWADDAAVLTPSGIRVGPAQTLLSDPDLLASAGLRQAWSPAVTAFLRTRNLLAETAPGPKTPEALSAWT
ncbi:MULTISPECIES: ATP-binding cassette domain-containing protein [unclassified Streptomyces]|uniref:ATP-binding cassette domain-containing protein n=1 Tax=unclassified Streptomyces TaxID=2593676 RepID=UPI002250B33A|nr:MULTISPECIES: ATP-binding cassette domain-containing protein [unclassified Streptomyces]MCX4528223.1 ATP-binding cassette domain-containing protein [Streptomyces sp. NBC_01551]MCX4541177.1 ATP-binding cassette domain-containing protein [Streptomyces sp. NBC_01565]